VKWALASRNASLSNDDTSMHGRVRRNEMRPSSSTLLCILVAAVSAGPSTAFVPTTGALTYPIPSLHAGNDYDGEMPSSAAVDEGAANGGDGSQIGLVEKFRIPNPLAELADIFSNFDDVVDDFFNKRVSLSAFRLLVCTENDTRHMVYAL
jgi:hypothetical protein